MPRIDRLRISGLRNLSGVDLRFPEGSIWLVGDNGAGKTSVLEAVYLLSRGASFRGYGVSLAMGVGIPIPILNEDVLKRTCVRDRDILAPVVDYSDDYPQNNGKVLCHVNYEQLRSGRIEVEGKEIAVGSLSSYHKALEIAHLLADEIRRGDFRLAEPIEYLPKDTAMKPLVTREKP